MKKTAHRYPAMIALRTDQTVGPLIRVVFHPDKNKHFWLNISAIPLYRLGEAEPFQVNAIFEDITARRQAKEEIRKGALLAKECFAAYFGVPLIAKGIVKGVLEVFHREPVEINNEWLAFLETLAGQAAIAVDNAKLLSRQERSSVDLLHTYDATIEGWAHALDLKPKSTASE